MNEDEEKIITPEELDFAEIAEGYYNLHLGFEKVQVVFNKNQLEETQTALQAEFNSVFSFGELSNSIKRLFTIAMKVAIILTFLEECEGEKLKGSIDCSKVTLEMAINFMRTNLNHSYIAFELLPKKEKSSLSMN